MNCLVCDGKGWLKAAPLSADNNFVLWGYAVMVPCWGCVMTNLAVIA